MISVIVPVYNGAAFLRETLESLIGQSFTDWEAWLIDDGSMDESPEIMKEYAEKDKRVRYLHQTNQGVGKARNAGLEMAAGDWICFLDGDDILTEDALSHMYKTAVATGADLVVGNFCYRYECRNIVSPPQQPLNGCRVLEGKDRISCIHLHPIPLNKMWRRDIIEQKNLRFGSFRIIEDMDFLFQFLLNCRRVVVTDRVTGIYRLHQKSASHVGCDSVFDIIAVFKHMKSSCEECGIHEEAECFRRELVFDEIFHYCMVFRSLPRYREKQNRQKIMNAFIEAERGIDYSAAKGDKRTEFYRRRFKRRKRLRKIYESDCYCMFFREGKKLRDRWKARTQRQG